jgi:hypothetical protein
MRNENKIKVIEFSLQEITIRSDNNFTMQCYNTVSECDPYNEISNHQIEPLVFVNGIISKKIKYQES